jgi:hypothetical protein
MEPETTIDPTPTTLSPLVGDDLAFTEGYQDRIGEHAEGSTFTNIADVFKSNKEAQRTITELNQTKSDLTKQIEAGLPAAEIKLPADVAAYKAELKLPEMPEGVTIGDDVLDKAMAYALEKGHPPEALADFLAFDLQRMEIEQEKSKTVEFDQLNAAKGVIVEAVGAQNYDTTIDDAKFVSEALGLPLESSDLVGQPNMVIALSKLKQALSEGTLKGASVGGVEITAGGKLSQAEDIISNSENPLNAAFHDNSHPQHETALGKHARLIMESAL